MESKRRPVRGTLSAKEVQSKTSSISSIAGISNLGGQFGNKIVLNEAQIKFVRDFVGEHEFFHNVIQHKTSECTANGGFMISVNNQELPPYDEGLTAVREVLEWAIRELELFGMVAVRVTSERKIQRLFLGVDYTVTMDMGPNSLRKWEAQSLTDVELDNVILFIQPSKEPSLAGNLKSSGFQVINDLILHSMIEADYKLMISSNNQVKTIVQPNPGGDENARKIVGLGDAIGGGTGDTGRLTQSDIALVEEKMKGVAGYMFAINYLNGVPIADTTGRETFGHSLDIRPVAEKLKAPSATDPGKAAMLGQILFMPPFLTATPVPFMPPIQDHDERLRSVQKRMYVAFGIAENKIFPSAGHISEKALAMSESSASHSTQRLQMDLISFGLRIYLAMKYEELVDKVSQNDPSESRRIWESLNVAGTFLGFNPLLDPTSIKEIYIQRVINFELFQTMMLTYFGLPSTMASKEGETAPRPDANGQMPDQTASEPDQKASKKKADEKADKKDESKLPKKRALDEPEKKKKKQRTEKKLEPIE